MFKKVFCLIAILALFLLLVGCNSADDTDGSTENPGGDSTDNAPDDGTDDDTDNDVAPGVESTAGLEFALNEDGSSYTVTGLGSCREPNIVIDMHNGLPVTKIDRNAFKYVNGLEHVTISGHTTSIGSSAFYDCEGLESITLSGDIECISSMAFGSCKKLSSVTLGEGVKTIGLGVFFNCNSLVSITVPDSVTSVDSAAFSNCSALKSIRLGSGISSITANIFPQCTSLTDVSISDGNSHYKSEGGCIYSKDGKTLVCYITSEDPFSFTVPDGVEIIGDSAFINAGELLSITLPRSIVSIPDYSLNGIVNLFELINHSSLDLLAGSDENGYLSRNAFIIHDGTSKLENKDGLIFATVDGENYLVRCATNDESIILPESYNDAGYKIYHEAFSGCSSVLNLTIPDGVTAIGNFAFAGCSGLESVTVGNGVTSIGYYAFSNCTGLKSISLGSNVKDIGKKVFEKCTALECITVDENNTSYSSVDGNLYSYDGKLMICYAPGKTEEIFVLPNGVEVIGKSAFSDVSNIISVVLSDEVTSIESYAFFDCPSLASITLPEKLTSIEDCAFDNCYLLVEVINHSKLNLEKGSEEHGYVAANAIEIHTAESKIAIYDDYVFYAPTKPYVNCLLGYRGEQTDLVLPDSFNGEPYAICDYAFCNRTDITSVIIGDGVTKIGGFAFNSCTELTSITIGDGVEEIGRRAFAKCKKLTSIYIPGNVKEIKSSAFSNCTSLKNVIIDEGVEALKSLAFASCHSLESIVIPKSVTEVKELLLEYSPMISAVYYAGSNVEWQQIEIKEPNEELLDAPLYFYSETKPDEEISGWHFDENGNAVVW